MSLTRRQATKQPGDDQMSRCGCAQPWILPQSGSLLNNLAAAVDNLMGTANCQHWDGVQGHQPLTHHSHST